MSLKPYTRFRVLDRCGFRCHYCGETAPDVKLQIDHILPRSKGGTDDERNLIAACEACNRGKSDASLVTHENATDASIQEGVYILMSILRGPR